MQQLMQADFIAQKDDRILITGAAGFIGARLVRSLLEMGFRNLVCFVRPTGKASSLAAMSQFSEYGACLKVVRGNLLSREDCLTAAKDAVVVYNLAAGRGEKSVPDAFMNSVVATRNLLDACVHNQKLRRFVNVSSFAVYTNQQSRRTLDETCPVEMHPELRGDAYSFAKVKQEAIVNEYAAKFGIPSVILRPGYVYGPGNEAITGRVGTGTFGLFLHLGGSNQIPFSYVDNCADAIALAGLKPGVDGEVFNVVDDDLLSSRQFLRLYKRNVKRFRSVYVPHVASYALCYLWERYSQWSQGQLPPTFNRRTWRNAWKKTRYTNAKLKSRLGWSPRVPASEALRRYFESCRKLTHA